MTEGISIETEEFCLLRNTPLFLTTKKIQISSFCSKQQARQDKQIPQNTLNNFLMSFQFCKLYLVKFCPHDLFVNTRADLGACSRVHDDEARELFEKASYSYRKQQYEDEFIRFCQGMLNEVERKIIKGKQRLALIGRTEAVSFCKDITLQVFSHGFSGFSGKINNLK